ncbi:Metallo-dependent phosphatase-like protein, partial [Polychytrium aggregatum]|uniref:Metallo-dependent phosphatase-like protein n=1 Tax=Polychytrium aggregatum TaxID=110093 RepID=UPI0022FF1B7E
MIIGDWGNAGAGQNNTAALMKTVAGQNNISMVLSLGDNFYSNSLDSAESYEGVKSSTDPKWTDLWQNMYLSGPLSTVPWWSVAGNHDWYGALGANPDADVQHSQVDSRWIMPDFFWDKTVTVNGFTVGFVFVDTDLLFYGYQDVNSKKFGANFVNHGWTAANNSIQQHLDTIEGYLKAHQNDDYLIVIGHHPLGTCSPTGNMTLLENLLATYQPSAYMFGHTHAMQFNRHHNTMYIQSGTGGNAEAACNMTGVEQWAIGSNYGSVSST